MFITLITFSWSGIRSEGHGMFSFSNLSLRGLRRSWYEYEEMASRRPTQRRSVCRSSSPTYKWALNTEGIQQDPGNVFLRSSVQRLGKCEIYIFGLNITQYIKLCVLKYTFLVGTRLGNCLYEGNLCQFDTEKKSRN